jgi:hypothetical protein
MSPEFTILFTRQEIEWMYRHFDGDRKYCAKIIDEFKTKDGLNDAQKGALQYAETNIEMLTEKSKDLFEVMGKGMTNLGILVARKDELKERHMLTEEAHAKQGIEKELGALEAEEEYKITMNRHSIKYMIRVIDETINTLKNKVIPSYQKRPDEAFENHENPRTRSYYINKALRDKVLIEDIRVRLEKRL